MSTKIFGNNEVIGQLSGSLQRWMTLERFHLHKPERYQNASLDPAFDTGYFPQNCGAFELPCFWIRDEHLHMYGTDTRNANEPGLFVVDELQKRILFPVHPTSLDHYRAFFSDVDAVDAATQGLRIWAVPTSSTRTLLAWPDEAPERAIFIKTSLHSPMFGDRRLYTTTVGRSVGLCGLVQASRRDLPAALNYLPEPFGFVPRKLSDGGVVIRSIPREIKDGHVFAAPLFSLIGGSGSHVPLFLTLLEHGMPPRQFLELMLCAPFATLWLKMSLRSGLLLEAHGQDLMLALSPELAPLGGFIYRDFEGLQVDWELRHRRGLPMPTNMPNAWRWRETYDTWGYNYGAHAWWKLRISLLNYLRWLAELELSLRQWHQCGLIHGPKVLEGEVTMMFTRCLLREIAETFGVRPEAEYDIYRHINRFMIFLMRLRRDILR